MPSIKQTEADLCAAFIKWAKAQGWVAYAETGGWDIVLVGEDVQLGIQAKRAFNATLLRQSLPERPYWREVENGPRYRGVLLPTWDLDVSRACEFCGLIYFTPGKAKRHRSDGDGAFEADFIPELKIDRWPLWPGKPIKLPKYVPDVAAGASAPVQLTEWKVGALKICALLEINGKVATKDFRYAGIDHRRWVPMEWLKIADGNYVRGPKLSFDKQHPVVYQQILAEVRELFSEPKEAKSGKS